MMLQRSPEWFQARVGRVTASRVADVIATTRSGWGASRANYMAELLAERLTGNVQESFTSAAMQWGTDTEPKARAAYEFYAEVEVEEVGFIAHPTLFAGASPDGLVGKDGLVEIKCPNTATHIDTLLGAPIPDKYQVQMAWQMACTDRAWCEWVSFDPRLPARMQFHVKRVARDDERIAELEKQVAAFLSELDEREEQLRDRYLKEERRALKHKLETSLTLMAG